MPRVNLDGLSPRDVEELAAHAENLRCRKAASDGFASCEKDQTMAVAASDRPVRDYGAQTRPMTEEVSLENVDDVMRYQPWMPDQVEAGDIVREALIAAVKALLRVVPRSPNRTKAVNHLVDARMDANAAISFRGRF